jgi:hypothetical protein
MPNQVPFRLNRNGLMLALISTAFAGEAGAAAAGRIEFTIGGATVSGSNGQQRPLAKGLELDKGDTVHTGQDGRAQIRFSDGAYVSLQPNTEFAIRDYNFEGKTDGSERGLFGLAKGAMRTVTGLIGRVNRKQYAIVTPTATIGIRGTGGRIEVLNDGSTLINGTSGIWTLSNPAGTIDIPAGLSGKAPSTPNKPPEQTTETPKAGPAPVSTPPVQFAVGEERTSTGALASLCTDPTSTTGACAVAVNLNPPLVTGSGYHVSYSYVDITGLAGLNSSGTLANATFDAAGMLKQFSATNSATFNGTHQEFGTAGGVVAWGRWTGPVTGVDGSPISLNPDVNRGYHYVIGIPATGMPTTGIASYTLVGATKATGGDGTQAGTFSGTLSVNFGASPGSISLAAALAFAGFTYNLSGSTSFTPGSAQWNTGTVGVTVAGAAPAGYNCPCTCSAAINGAFFGAGAAFAGYAYQVNGGGNQRVAGAAAFKQ